MYYFEGEQKNIGAENDGEVFFPTCEKVNNIGPKITVEKELCHELNRILQGGKRTLTPRKEKSAREKGKKTQG